MASVIKGVVGVDVGIYMCLLVLLILDVSVPGVSVLNANWTLVCKTGLAVVFS